MRAVKDKGVDIIGKKMTLLGAGGAATAILVQAALDGVAEIQVFNIKDAFWERAQDIVNQLNERTTCKVTLHDYEDPEVLRAAIADSAILVNGTSVGMAPKTDATLLQIRSMSNRIFSYLMSSTIQRRRDFCAKQRQQDVKHPMVCICFCTREQHLLNCGQDRKCRWTS